LESAESGVWSRWDGIDSEAGCRGVVVLVAVVGSPIEPDLSLACSLRRGVDIAG